MSVQATDRQCFIIALSFPLHAIVFALKFIYFKYLYEDIFQACDTAKTHCIDILVIKEIYN